MSDINTRMRSLQQAAQNGTLAKSLGIGKYVITGWLGGVAEDGTPEPRVRMETMEIRAKGLTAAKALYLRQYKNRLPADALDLNTGLVILRTSSTEAPRQFPEGTPMMQGNIKFWRDAEGTGFVTADGHDYFVHHSEVVCDEDVFPTFTAGQVVQFVPATRKEQPIACSVTVVE